MTLSVTKHVLMDQIIGNRMVSHSLDRSMTACISCGPGRACNVCKGMHIPKQQMDTAGCLSIGASDDPVGGQEKVQAVTFGHGVCFETVRISHMC